MSIGAKIRTLRIEKGLTQTELGAGLVTPSMISQIESDRANPSYKVLEQLAERLDTPLEHFLSDMQSNLEVRISHKIAKAMIAAHKYEQAAQLLKVIFGDTEAIDSLEARLDLGECYLQLGHYQEAHDLYQQVIEVAEKKSQILYCLQALNKIGHLERNRQKYHLAVFYWKKAQELFANLAEREPFLQSQIFTNLGSIHHLLGEYEDSQMYYSEAYRLLADTSNYEQIGSVYLELAQSYKVAGYFEKASEFAQHAVSIANVAQNAKFAIDVKRNFAMIMAETGQATEALILLNECLDQYKHDNYTEDVALVYQEMARLFYRDQDFDQCLMLCDTALSYLADDQKPRASILFEKARVQNELGLIDEAILTLESAVKLFKSHALLTGLSQSLALLAELHEKKGEVRKANESLRLMRQALQDQLRGRGIVL